MLQYSKEDFGYLVSFPDGSVDLFSHEAGPHLAVSRSPDDLDPYKLDRISVPPNFHLRAPLIVWFEVTRKCNLTCTHCYIDAGRPRANELSFREITSILDDLKGLGVFSIVLAGGEPYARRDFPDILEYASNLGFTIAVVTNGSFLSPELLSRVPRHNCRVTLSVDGIQSHHTIRGGNSTFELMKERLYLMKELGVPCSVSTVISKANIHELGELLRWCMANDVVFRTVTFNPLGRGLRNLKTHALDERDAEESAELFMLQKRYESEKDKEIGRCVSKYFGYALNLMFMTRREHCSRSIAYIASNGDVYPCVTSAATSTFSAGNVREHRFSHLWEHSFRDHRAITWEPFVDAVCHECPFNEKEYFCANRCPVMSLVINGEIIGCGATEFEKADLRLRTERLRSEMGYVL